MIPINASKLAQELDKLPLRIKEADVNADHVKDTEVAPSELDPSVHRGLWHLGPPWSPTVAYCGFVRVGPLPPKNAPYCSICLKGCARHGGGIGPKP